MYIFYIINILAATSMSVACKYSVKTMGVSDYSTTITTLPAVPTTSPSLAPSSSPTGAPTSVPTIAPTGSPTIAPTSVPTITPTSVPTIDPTLPPTAVRRRLNLFPTSQSLDITSGSGVWVQSEWPALFFFGTNGKNAALHTIYDDFIGKTLNFLHKKNGFTLFSKKIAHLENMRFLLCYDLQDKVGNIRAVAKIINVDLEEVECAFSFFDESKIHDCVVPDNFREVGMLIKGRTNNDKNLFFTRVFDNCTVGTSTLGDLGMPNITLNKGVIDIAPVAESTVQGVPSSLVFYSIGYTAPPSLRLLLEDNQCNDGFFVIGQNIINKLKKTLIADFIEALKIKKQGDFLTAVLKLNNTARIINIPLSSLFNDNEFSVGFCDIIYKYSKFAPLNFSTAEIEGDMVHLIADDNVANHSIYIKFNSKNHDIDATRIVGDYSGTHNGKVINIIGDIIHTSHVFTKYGKRSIRLVPLSRYDLKVPDDNCDFYTNDDIEFIADCGMLPFETLNISYENIDIIIHENITKNILSFKDDGFVESICEGNAPQHEVTSSVPNNTSQSSKDDDDYVIAIILGPVAVCLICCLVVCFIRNYLNKSRRYINITDTVAT